jgi:Ni/Fe-hydrogenase subunit HybB-like protein
MVSLESLISGKAFGHAPDMGILSGLARGVLITSSVYLVVKLYLLAAGPGIAAAFAGTYESNMYLAEMAVSTLIPIALLSQKSIRENADKLLWTHAVVVTGVLINRLNVSVIGLYRDQSATGLGYFPSWMEIAVTLSIVVAGMIVFRLVVRNMPVFHGLAKPARQDYAKVV